MKFAATLALAAATLVVTMPASAQFAKPEDAVKYRQSAMFIMGQNFGRIGAMANGRVPYDAKAASDYADVVQSMSRLPWPAYMAGTEKLSKNTKAESWTEPKFKELQEKLMADTSKLQAASRTGNLDNLKAAFRDTAGTCKSCHDAYTTF